MEVDNPLFVEESCLPRDNFNSSRQCNYPVDSWRGVSRGYGPFFQNINWDSL